MKFGFATLHYNEQKLVNAYWLSQSRCESFPFVFRAYSRILLTRSLTLKTLSRCRFIYFSGAWRTCSRRFIAAYTHLQ